MFFLPNIEMASISPVIFTALAVLAGTLLKEVLAITMKHLPLRLHDKIFSILDGIIGNYFSKMTLIIDEKLTAGSMNEMFEASENYMLKRISPSVKRLKVSKAERERELCITLDYGVEIVDTFQGIQFTWKYIKNLNSDFARAKSDFARAESILFELSFHKKHWNMVQTSYLPHVLKESEAKKEENKVTMLRLKEGLNPRSDDQASINLDHPSTFKTLAMDPTRKEELIADLDRFVKRKDFYRRVGKVWKRGYLLYGPSGTGKSSLIAAIANHLKFHIYDLELNKFRHHPSELKRFLLSAANKSILVIEDIDSSSDVFQDKKARHHDFYDDNQLTLSTLLNFIDGLWSSCGDERIIIFTTNHKERLDPAILRPGRMDMHIHMSYCTFDGFKILAFNYLSITDHPMFTEIKNLLRELEVTPAEIAEELMRTDEPDRALGGFIEFLHKKRTKHGQGNAEKETEVGEQATEIPRNEEGTEEVSKET